MGATRTTRKRRRDRTTHRWATQGEERGGNLLKGAGRYGLAFRACARTTGEPGHRSGTRLRGYGSTTETPSPSPTGTTDVRMRASERTAVV